MVRFQLKHRARNQSAQGRRPETSSQQVTAHSRKGHIQPVTALNAGIKPIIGTSLMPTKYRPSHPKSATGPRPLDSQSSVRVRALGWHAKRSTHDPPDRHSPPHRPRSGSMDPNRREDAVKEKTNRVPTVPSWLGHSTAILPCRQTDHQLPNMWMVGTKIVHSFDCRPVSYLAQRRKLELPPRPVYPSPPGAE